MKYKDMQYGYIKSLSTWINIECSKIELESHRIVEKY